MTKEELLFCPLGGSGEIGGNMNLYAYGKEDNQKWIIVDMGVSFADDSVPGVDLIYPDAGFIIDKKEELLDEFENLLGHNKIFVERTADIGIMPKDVAINFGVSGPNLRASGVNWDLRKNEPYSVYDRFDFDIPIGQGIKGSVGDSWDRFYVRIHEIRQSVKIVRQAIDQLPKEGDVHQAMPKKIRPPKGSVYSRTESPRGDLGYYITSDGSDIPYRVKMRSPAFTALGVLNEIAGGWLMSDVLAILGSLDIVLGEIDR